MKPGITSYAMVHKGVFGCMQDIGEAVLGEKNFNRQKGEQNCSVVTQLGKFFQDFLGGPFKPYLPLERRKKLDKQCGEGSA